MSSTTGPVRFEPADTGACSHLGEIRPVEPSATGCSDCLRSGARWVHLRICLRCGHVGCCDDSLHRHARAHHEESGHAIVRSFEPGESWAWCFVDDVLIRPQT